MPEQKTSFRAPSLPSAVGKNFGTRKSEMPLRAGRRIGKPRQHEVHDVLGEVVLAIGDEDLLAEEAVGAVAAPLGAGGERAEIGAGLRLRQVHGRGPFAGDDARQVERLQRVACACSSSASTAPIVSSGQSEKDMQAAFHISCVAAESAIGSPCPPTCSGADDAAPARRASSPDKTSRQPGAVVTTPSFELRADRGRRRGSAAPVSRRRSGPASASTASTRSSVRLGKGAGRERLVEPGDVLQREGDFGDRRAIHGRFLVSAPIHQCLTRGVIAGERRACAISS